MEHQINSGTRVKNCPELMAASAESRDMPTRESDNAAMKAISQQVEMHKKLQWPHHPVITKHTYLIWAHMQRLHHLMTPELRKDCEQLLKHSLRISQAMVELACYRDWFFTAQAMIEFRRALVQGLDLRTPPLMQIPHFDEEVLKHCTRGKNSASTINDFLNKSPEQRKGLAKMEPQQLLDIDAFAAHLSDIELQATVEVEDETNIVVGDIVTVTVSMRRKNLKENEAVGPVHAPLFPDMKFEEWWLFLTEGTPMSKIITFERIRDTDQLIENKMRFQVTRPGKRKMEIHAMCDSYAGIDKKIEILFTALEESESNRQIFIHKEDEDLDLIPTLFQQMMGDLNGQDEESEDEADAAASKEKEKVKAKTNGKSSGKAETNGRKTAANGAGKKPSSEAGSSAKEETEPQEEDDDDDNSSDMSSDSD